ncbi:MAG: hypothetical protein CMA88_02670 [Euryarchaeota archaeon]|nr:hypothetical protein [Euryarchaeota archaeon]|tara:strand:- start:113 stop:388 length:276 start_codon:yes stop_codon:yes gene_type:complete
MSKDIPISISKLAKNQSMDATVRLGKGGVTDALLSELSEQLSRRRIVKVRANKGAASDRLHRNQIFCEIAEKSGSTIVFQRGNVAVFWSGK